MTAADVPGLVRVICECAGESAPIVLERPGMPEAWDELHAGPVMVARSSEPGKPVQLLCHDDITAAQARQAAAWLAALAEEADAEGEQEAADRLAEVIGTALGSRTDSHRIARAVLKAGYRAPEVTE